MTEFGVHGTRTAQGQPTPTPSPAPTVSPTPAPTATATPTVSPPSFSFPRRGRTTVKFKVACATPCDVAAKLTVDRPTAKQLGLGRRLTAGEFKQSRVRAGKTELTLKLTRKAKNALLKGPKTRTYRARIKATGHYPGSAPVTRSAQVTLKR